MKKSLVILVVTASVSLIVLLARVQVNESRAMPSWNSTTPLVDGIPMPPPPPKKTQVINNMLADGIPMPPPPPKKTQVISVLVADGIPMPPPPPKKPVSVA